MKKIFRTSGGFSLVGALTAATVGALSIMGLTQMAANIVESLGNSKQIFDLVTLSEEIRHSIKQGPPTPCTPPQNCFNSCTSSLFGLDASAEAYFAIKEPTQRSTIGTASTLYEGNNTYKGIKIQAIKFKPDTGGYGTASVHFSLSEDTRKTLTAPQSLHFTVFMERIVGGKIDECIITGTQISIANSCRRVDGDLNGDKRTLLGCGGTEENSASGATAFGYKAGGDADTGVYNSGLGNTFFGFEAGKKNTSGINNTFLGYQAGLENTTGENNTFLGYGTGITNTTGSNNILIGRQITLPHPTDNNKLNIGNLIEGENLQNLSLSPLSYPTVTLKAPVIIEPENLPSPDPPTPEPGLDILGKMVIQQKGVTPPPQATLQADGTVSAPEMTLIVDTLDIKKASSPNNVASLSVSGITGNSELSFGADLEVANAASPGTSRPGVSVLGPLELRGRNNTSIIEVSAVSTEKQLKVNGDLIVAGTGTGSTSTSTISENLNITDNLTLPTSPPGTAKFKDLVVNDTGTFQKDITVSGTLTSPIPTVEITTLNALSGVSVTIGTANITTLTNTHTHSLSHPHSYSLIGHSHGCICANVPPCCACSSRTLKRNIKPFKDYDKALKDIVSTPLFTWQYKKDKGDHPEKIRRGIISEELPKNLQILEKGKASSPDWISIYGTLWAGMKALAQKLKDFKEEHFTQISQLSREFKEHLTNQTAQLKKDITAQIKNMKSELKQTQKELQKQVQNTPKTTKEFSKLKKQFQEAALTLKNRQEELKKIRAELKNIRLKIKEAEGME